MADYLTHLEECVKATEGCVQRGQGAIDQLRPGTRDLPRLSKILKNQHHFLLLPAPLLAEYKSELSDSLAPQIETLVARAEMVLGREEEKKVGLGERLDLLRSARGSNNNTSRTTGGATAAASGPKSVTSATSAGQAPFEPKDLSLAQKKKLNLLKARRDRLTRELARMED